LSEAKQQLGRHFQFGTQESGSIFPEQQHTHRIGFLESRHGLLPFGDRPVPQFSHECIGGRHRAVPGHPAQQGIPTEFSPQEHPERDAQNEQVQEQPNQDAAEKWESKSHSGSSGSTIM
jgi:hypothetical protein